MYISVMRLQVLRFCRNKNMQIQNNQEHILYYFICVDFLLGNFITQFCQ